MQLHDSGQATMVHNDLSRRSAALVNETSLKSCGAGDYAYVTGKLHLTQPFSPHAISYSYCKSNQVLAAEISMPVPKTRRLILTLASRRPCPASLRNNRMVVVSLIAIAIGCCIGQTTLGRPRLAVAQMTGGADPAVEKQKPGSLQPGSGQSGSGQPAQVPEQTKFEPKKSEPAVESGQGKPPFKFEKRGAILFREGDDFRLTCDLYVPLDQGKFPAVIAIHGGAWRMGSKLAMTRHAWRLARAGYVVVAINYRHAPKHPFPAQIHDCKYAVRWIRANADSYQIDATRIGAFGYSAGGHLAAMLGTTDAGDELEGDIPAELQRFDSRVSAVAAGGAPCEFDWIDEDSQSLAYWLGGTRRRFPNRFRLASPVTYASAGDPPFFLFHGETDWLVPPAASRALHQRLRAVGVESEHHVGKNAGHFATFSDLDWMKEVIEFFDCHLKTQVAEPTPNPSLEKGDEDKAREETGSVTASGGLTVARTNWP